jgi:hypothetical protein
MQPAGALRKSSVLVRRRSHHSSSSRVVRCWDLFRKLLGLLLCLRTELLGLVDGSVGALLDLVGGLAELALGSGKTVLSLELESLLATTHAVFLLVLSANSLCCRAWGLVRCNPGIRTTSAGRNGSPELSEHQS